MNKISNNVAAAQLAWHSQDLAGIEKAIKQPRDRIQFEKWLSKGDRFTQTSDRNFQVDVLRLLQGRVTQQSKSLRGEDQRLANLAAQITTREPKGFFENATHLLGVSAWFEPDMVALARDAKDHGLNATSDVLMGGVAPVGSERIEHYSGGVAGRNIGKLTSALRDQRGIDAALDLLDVAPSWMIARVVGGDPELLSNLHARGAYEVSAEIACQLSAKDLADVCSEDIMPAVYMGYALVREGDIEGFEQFADRLSDDDLADMLLSDIRGWPMMSQVVMNLSPKVATDCAKRLSDDDIEQAILAHEEAQRSIPNVLAASFQAAVQELRDHGAEEFREAVNVIAGELANIGRMYAERRKEAEGDD